METVSTSSRKSSRIMTVTKTVTRTGPDGKTVTETVTEEKIVNDDDNSELTELSPKFQLTGFAEKFEKDFEKFGKGRFNKEESKDNKDEGDATSSSSSSDDDDDQEFNKVQRQALDCHNSYREKHGVKKLKLSKKLCQHAQEWADKLAKQDKIQHRSDKQYGENLFSSWSSDKKSKVSVKEAVDSWYQEVKKYTFGVEPRTSGTGHFSQLVWKSSNELGIGTAKSATGTKIVVANYNPPGNYLGKYVENVPSPINK